ncbi:AAA family ATPase [Pedobacter sp. UC225_61]|uniref:AAA family ATPase n=1 Tax=Pedobacter sp. UC225_61 TaxID=3374623 RepID=UPI0037BB6596
MNSLKDFVNLVHDLKYVSNDWKEKCDDRKLPEVKIGENILFQLSIIVINAGFENLSSNELMVSIERFNHLFRAILNSSRLELRSLEEIFDFWESQLTQVQFLEGTSQSMPDDAIRKLGQFKKVWKIAVKLLSNLDQRGRISVISFEGNRAMSLIDDFFSSEISEFVNFKWPKMSAGEEAMLSFYSRLNSVMNNVKTDDLLLLIDEGDLYFHPEWQRKYLFYLLSFLKKSSQQIQVVYTTHSPFLISDLPKENIVLLGQKADSEKFQTFGANLYTLFSKAFFLGEHTTSEFARLKIKTEILDKLKSDKQNSENRNLNVLVDKIGEPVLKTLILNRIKSGSNG